MSMSSNQAQYEEFLIDILSGAKKGDRTGTGTTSIFGYQMRFDLRDGFPLVTTKKVHMKSIVAELLWFLSGSTNNNDLEAMGSTIWREWARADGELGPIYGHQWRSWMAHDNFGNATCYDQISEAIRLLKTDPDSRRIIVSAWNVADLKDMALMPCHALFQFYTRELSYNERNASFELRLHEQPDEELENQYGETDFDDHPAFLDARGVPKRALSCQLYQRSADAFLGVPFNIASYALLTHMMAQQCNMLVDRFIWTGGDCHIYDNHREQVSLQLERQPLPFPTLRFTRKPDSIFDYKPEDILIEGYNCHPAIKAPVAV